MSDRKLTIDDIADLRAYEREREAFRPKVIELKKRRRVAVGPFITMLFENRDTIRFQIQEMARAERILSDDGIQAELDIYNPLIPEPGRLAATLFIELTSKDQLMEWLPQLVGIETKVELRLPGRAIPADVDPEHAAQLTREQVTASVHYVHFRLDDDAVERFDTGPVRLAAAHPNYAHEAELTGGTVAELLTDLRTYP